MGRFKYSPLPKKTSIRLIDLRSGNWLDPLVCQLHVADITNVSRYTALSYVWGDSDDTVGIQCEDRTLSITRNLDEALRHLRHDSDSVKLWVDAVCINQGDVDERSQQVKLMADIYRSADLVLVWLGQDETGIAQEAFDNIEAQVDFIRKLTAQDVELGQSRWHPLRESLDPVIALCRRAWFFRSWTVQEVGLARRVVLHWGQAELDWNKFGLNAMFLKRCLRTWLEDNDLYDDINRAVRVYSAFLPLQPQTNFIYVLDDLRSQAASDKRDKVYACLAHSSARTNVTRIVSTGNEPCDPATEDSFDEWRNLALIISGSSYSRILTRLDKDLNHPPRPPPADAFSPKKLLSKKMPKNSVSHFRPGPSFITPDYRKSVVDVYQDVALQIIERRGNLEILSAVQHGVPLPDIGPRFPSWIPRWDIDIRTPMLGRASCPHFAAANHRPIITATQDASILTVKAIMVDHVFIHNGMPIEKARLDPLNRTNPFFMMCHDAGIDSPDRGDYPKINVQINFATSNRQVAYCETWTAGKKALGDIDGPRTLDRMADYRAYQLCATEHVLANEVLNEETIECMQRLKEEAKGGSADRYRSAMAEVCHQRKFFITRAGFYGLGPGILELGDTICVIFGMDVPSIVRRKNGHRYQYIGECYVNGLMTAQAVRAWRDDILDAIDLELI